MHTLSDRHGVYSHHSFKGAEGFAFWFGGDNFYQTDGNVVRAIGNIDIRDIVDGIDESYYYKIISIIDSANSRYFTLVPYNDTVNNLAVSYNYKDETWTLFDWTQEDAAQGAPQFFADFYDSDGVHIFYGNMGGGGEDDINQFFDENANTDLGLPIQCSATTKYYGTDVQDTLKYMRRVSVQGSVVPENLTATLLGDNAEVKKGPVDVYMYPGRNWKRFPLANNGNLAASIAIKFDYAGTQALDLMAIGFDLVDTGRKVGISATS
jgi:hypothetical protein